MIRLLAFVPLSKPSDQKELLEFVGKHGITTQETQAQTGYLFIGDSVRRCLDVVATVSRIDCKAEGTTTCDNFVLRYSMKWQLPVGGEYMNVLVDPATIQDHISGTLWVVGSGSIWRYTLDATEGVTNQIQLCIDLTTPCGIAPCRSAGGENQCLWVADSQSVTVQLRAAKDGALLRTIGESFLLNVSDIATYQKWVYVLDAEAMRVLQFQDDGTYVRAWYLSRDDAKTCNTPHFIEVTNQGTVLVLHASCNTIQVFEHTGDLLSTLQAPTLESASAATTDSRAGAHAFVAPFRDVIWINSLKRACLWQGQITPAGNLKCRIVGKAAKQKQSHH